MNDKISVVCPNCGYIADFDFELVRQTKSRFGMCNQCMFDIPIDRKKFFRSKPAPGIKARRKPFLTAADLVLLREMKIKL